MPFSFGYVICVRTHLGICRGRVYSVLKPNLTIDVPLFKKMRDIIFFAGQSLYEPFQGTVWEGQDFFDPLNCPEQLTRVRFPANAVLCYRFWRQSLIMSSSPIQCLKCGLCGGTLVSIAAFKAGTPGSIPGRCSFVLQVLKTESYHESRSCF